MSQLLIARITLLLIFLSFFLMIIYYYEGNKILARAGIFIGLVSHLILGVTFDAFLQHLIHVALFLLMPIVVYPIMIIQGYLLIWNVDGKLPDPRKSLIYRVQDSYKGL